MLSTLFKNQFLAITSILIAIDGIFFEHPGQTTMTGLFGVIGLCIIVIIVMYLCIRILSGFVLDDVTEIRKAAESVSLIPIAGIFWHFNIWKPAWLTELERRSRQRTRSQNVATSPEEFTKAEELFIAWYVDQTTCDMETIENMEELIQEIRETLQQSIFVYRTRTGTALILNNNRAIATKIAHRLLRK